MHRSNIFGCGFWGKGLDREDMCFLDWYIPGRGVAESIHRVQSWNGLLYLEFLAWSLFCTKRIRISHAEIYNIHGVLGALSRFNLLFQVNARLFSVFVRIFIL